MTLEIQKTEAPAPAASATTVTQPTTAVETKTEDLKPGTPEYNAHMAELGRRARGEIPSPTHEVEQKEPEKTDDRPQWLPEKFKSAEDLAKAYGELEKKLGSKAAEGAKAEGATDAAPGTTDEDEAVKTYEKYFSEIRDEGTLSEESYKALTQKFPKYLVDAHIELAKQVNELSDFKRQQDEAEVIKTLGGPEVYKQVSTWAAQNLSDSEREAFNQQVVTSKETAVLLLQGLKARMEASTGRIPSLLTGQSGGQTADIFGSKADFQMAMADSRYSSDQAYRAAVYEKLRRTKAVNPGFSVV